MNRIAPGHSRTAAPGSRSRKLVFWILMGFAAIYLIAEHRLHLAGDWRWLPILILLACPLLHLFGHGGHGHHGDHEPDRAVPPNDPSGTDTSTGSAPAPQASRPHSHRGERP